MNSAALRERIDRALQHEAENGCLAARLAGRTEGLHRLIRLPETDAAGTLMRFAQTYVGRLPTLMEAALHVAEEAGMDAPVGAVLRLAEEFLLARDRSMDGHAGLESLLDEAYLAHRLVEEINDRYIAHLGQPLLPLDTTLANLVAHQLIGSSFATQLDAAVERICDGLLDAQVFAAEALAGYRERLDATRVLAAWRKWPGLTDELGIELHVDWPQAKPAVASTESSVVSLRRRTGSGG